MIKLKKNIFGFKEVEENADYIAYELVENERFEAFINTLKKDLNKYKSDVEASDKRIEIEEKHINELQKKLADKISENEKMQDKINELTSFHERVLQIHIERANQKREMPKKNKTNGYFIDYIQNYEEGYKIILSTPYDEKTFFSCDYKILDEIKSFFINETDNIIKENDIKKQKELIKNNDKKIIIIIGKRTKNQFISVELLFNYNSEIINTFWKPNTENSKKKS